MQIHRGSQDKTQILRFMSWVLVSLASPVRRAECQLSADNRLEPQPNETKFPPSAGTRLGEEERRLWEGGGQGKGTGDRLHWGWGVEARAGRVSEAQDARQRKGTIAELWGMGTGPNKIKRRTLRAGRAA